MGDLTKARVERRWGEKSFKYSPNKFTEGSHLQDADSEDAMSYPCIDPRSVEL